MKLLSIAALICLAFIARAENAQETTVNIKEGAPSQVNSKKYEIHESDDDITGDKAPLKKTAEQNWKKACGTWVKEFKENHKENKETRIISYSCGRMTCEKEGVETTCTSKAKYKVRVLIKEKSN